MQSGLRRLSHVPVAVLALAPTRLMSLLIRCERSPTPVSVGVNTLWPCCSSKSDTRRQHQPPSNGFLITAAATSPATPAASPATSGSNRGRRLSKVHRATEWLKPSFARSSATMSASVRDQMPKPSCVSCQLGSPTTTRFTRTRLSDIVHPVTPSQLTQDPDRVRSFGGHNMRSPKHVNVAASKEMSAAERQLAVASEICRRHSWYHANPAACRFNARPVFGPADSARARAFSHPTAQGRSG
jgi:hypothetical protein